MEVKADGYTSHTHPKTFEEYWKNDKPIDFILYNQLHFQPGKRYSIILPETPDASLGRYYSLHHVEDGKIIFERDPSPRANTPYIFFPEYEATISLGNMDLTQTPGCTIVNEDPNSQTAESDSRVFFEGFYTTGARSQYYLAPIYSVRKIEEEAYYQEGNGRYLFDAMHAILFYRWNLFSSTPELVFRDSIDVPTAIHDTPVQQMVNGKHVNSKCYDLSGRRINNGQLPRGVYIKDGRKMVVR